MAVLIIPFIFIDSLCGEKSLDLKAEVDLLRPVTHNDVLYSTINSLHSQILDTNFDNVYHIKNVYFYQPTVNWLSHKLRVTLTTLVICWYISLWMNNLFVYIILFQQFYVLYLLQNSYDLLERWKFEWGFGIDKLAHHSCKWIFLNLNVSLS